MPKLKKPPDKYRDFKLLVHGNMRLQGVTQAEAAERLGMCPKTLRSRLNRPDSMTLGEVKQLAVLLDIPADEIRAAIPIK